MPSLFYAGQTDYIGKLNSISSEYVVTDINATTGGVTSIDCSLGAVFFVNMGAGNTTLSFTNIPTNINTFKITIYIQQDVTGSRTVTWPASVAWPSGSAPTLTTTGSRVDIFEFRTINSGTRFYGSTVDKNYVE